MMLQRAAQTNKEQIWKYTSATLFFLKMHPRERESLSDVKMCNVFIDEPISYYFVVMTDNL